MEQKLISFQTAKLAKELKFDSSCDALYIVREPDEVGELIEMYCELKFTENRPYYLAPPQSVLQTWIRDEFEMPIWVYSHLDSETEKIIYKYSYIDQKGITWSSLSYYNFYETALEDGLYEVLKEINL